MSVPVGQRGETKLAVIDKAEKLCAYTINITSNEKRFPKRYRWCLNDKIVEKAINITVLAHEANGVYPKTKHDLDYRLLLQLKAIAEINGLLTLITVAHQCYGIKLENIETWLQMVTYERTLLKKWREADILKKGELPDE